MNGEYKIGDVVLGSWKLVKLLGEGAYGKVYEAHREDFGTTYTAAIKIMTIPASQSEVDNARAEGMDEESVTAYFNGMVKDVVQEFALMSELKGTANIVSYEDHSVTPLTDGIGWDVLIRMELLTPMLRYMSSHKMTRSDIIKLGTDMCKALELCQRYNIIHRDIKPENIFISRTGDYKLGDFGVARTLEKTTGGLSKKGTYTYMAPEVYKNEKYGSTVDIYSLGIVLYRLLNNNRAPFLPAPPQPISYREREQALERRISGEPLPVPANAEGRLSEIVLKACAYDSKDRYTSPLQMRQELEAIQYEKQNDALIYGENGQIFVDKTQYTRNSHTSNAEKKETGQKNGGENNSAGMEEETTSFASERTGYTELSFLTEEEQVQTPGEMTVLRAQYQKELEEVIREEEQPHTPGEMTVLRTEYQKELERANSEEEQKKQEEEKQKKRKEENYKKQKEEHKAQEKGRQKQTYNLQAEPPKKKTGLSIGIAAAVVLTIVTLILWPRLHDQSLAQVENDTVYQIDTSGEKTWNWSLENGVLTISGTGNMEEFLPELPWEDQKEEIKQVVIEEGITSVCTAAFDECINLKNVTFPESLTIINDRAFQACSLTSVVFPEKLSVIGRYAFSRCRLKSVVLPKSITTIGAAAFSSCTHLSQIELDTNNDYYMVRDGVLFSKDGETLVCYPAGKKDVSYKIPNTVHEVGEGSFLNCCWLSSITIPDSVVSIGDYAFYSCYKLTDITIPDSVITIGDYAIAYCYELKSLIIPKSVTAIKTSTFSQNNKLTDIYYEGSETQWATVFTGDIAETSTNTQIHFNSEMPEPDLFDLVNRNNTNIACGLYHVAVRNSDGTVSAYFIPDWEYGDVGQTNVSEWKDVAAVYSGQFFTIGITRYGRILVAGNHINGVDEWNSIIDICSDGGHVVGLKKDGTVLSIGLPAELANRVAQWEDIVDVALGGYFLYGENGETWGDRQLFVVGLSSDGTVKTIGADDYGQCDTAGWTDVVSVEAGDYHTYGLKADGTVLVAGNYTGNGVENPIADGLQPPTWEHIVSITAGRDNTRAGYDILIGITENGEMLAVGGLRERESLAFSDVHDIIDAAAGNCGLTVCFCRDGKIKAIDDFSDWIVYDVHSEMLQMDWVNESEKQDNRKTVDIVVVHGDGKKTYYMFKTDSENLRGALEEKQLIEGESSEYGLFVSTVDGETADEAKQQWWSITKGGKPIETGIDNVVIADGDSYELTLITGW